MDEVLTISNALQKAYAICLGYKRIMVSVSGGADSDTMLDLLLQVVPKEKMTFVFFDTGIEYAATKAHLSYLEEKYGIEIHREKAAIPVPLGCKTYGLPFISKFVSEMIERLQKHNFDFAGDGAKLYDELMAKYPKCRGAITWWTNNRDTEGRDKSKFNINSVVGLKEFMQAYPPDFPISPKCCNGAKKRPSHEYEKAHNFDLKCVGLRKAEGGGALIKDKILLRIQAERGDTKIPPDMAL